jgi:hypothetical protein
MFILLNALSFTLIINKRLAMKAISKILEALIVFVVLIACTQNQNNERKEEVRSPYLPNSSASDSVNPPAKIFNFIKGDWALQNVKGRSQTVRDAAAHMQRITFTRESRYLLYGNNHVIDSGALRVNEPLGIIYLESSTDGEIAEWRVFFNEEGQMRLSLRNVDNPADSVSYIFKRE